MLFNGCWSDWGVFVATWWASHFGPRPENDVHSLCLLWPQHCSSQCPPLQQHYYGHRGPFDLLKCCHSHAVSYRLPQVPKLPIWCPQIRGVPLASPPTQPNTSGLQPPAHSLGQGFVLDVWWFCQWHRSSSAGEMQPPPRVFFKPMSF